MSEPRRQNALVRWYPPAWRQRYGDEFSAMLEQEREHEAGSRSLIRSVRRSVDVVRGGLRARLDYSATFGSSVPASDRVRGGLGLVVFGAAGFVPAVVCILVQALSVLSVSPSALTPPGPMPDTPLAANGVHMATITVLYLGGVVGIGLGLVAAAPILWTATRMIIRRQGSRVIAPVVQLVGSVALYVAGITALASIGDYPGGINPVRSVVLVTTLPLSSAWLSVGTLSGPILAWLLISTTLWIEVGVAGYRLVRTVVLPPRVLRFEVRMATAIAALTGLMVVLVVLWSSEYEPYFYSRLGNDQYFAGWINETARLIPAVVALLSAGVMGLGFVRARRSIRGTQSV